MNKTSRFIPVACMMGGLCRFHVTGCRSAPMAAPLASSALSRCEAVFHSYGTSPFVPTMEQAHLYQLMATL